MKMPRMLHNQNQSLRLDKVARDLAGHRTPNRHIDDLWITRLMSTNSRRGVRDNDPGRSTGSGPN
jgi:hypothetical protein